MRYELVRNYDRITLELITAMNCLPVPPHHLTFSPRLNSTIRRDNPTGGLFAVFFLGLDRGLFRLRHFNVSR